MFNNIKILSLEKNIKRRKFMDHKLEQVGIHNYTFFDAIDGNNIKEYQDYENFCKKHSRKILNGEQGAFGCLMSYKQLFFNQLLPCLVIEDDVYFHKNHQKIMADLKSEDVFNKYDIVYLGYNNYRLSKRQELSIKNNDLLMPIEHEYRFITCGTFAIWYSAKAISYLNKKLQNIKYEDIKPIDHIVWNLSKRLKSIIINPPLCISEIRDSDIRMPREMHSFYGQRHIDISNYLSVDEYEKYIAY